MILRCRARDLFEAWYSYKGSSAGLSIGIVLMGGLSGHILALTGISMFQSKSAAWTTYSARRQLRQHNREVILRNSSTAQEYEGREHAQDKIHRVAEMDRKLL